MILACTLDITIPLQAQRRFHLPLSQIKRLTGLSSSVNPNRVGQHEQHLEGYWPVQFFAIGVEVMCFFIIHPDLFTLVVCIKTTLMTALWLARRTDGSFVSHYIGRPTYANRVL